MKYCKDCKHCLKNQIYEERCGHPELATVEEFFGPVRGHVQYVSHERHCADERRAKSGKCGPEGKLWASRCFLARLWQRFDEWVCEGAE